MSAKLIRKPERLEARLTPEQKALLQRAADLSGRTLTEFVISSAQSAAEETIRTHQIIELTVRESEQLANALLNPVPPNERLRAAAARHWPGTDQ
ncbi:MAG: DUF1778 domain-containing protein [Chloroflexota bacterium]|nr:DUF1778 domain-containing protein [Chloroflexota bacterium]